MPQRWQELRAKVSHLGELSPNIKHLAVPIQLLFRWIYFKSLVKFLVQDIIVYGFIYFAPWILQQISADFLIWPFEIESPDARLCLAPADNRTAHSCNFTIVSLLVNNQTLHFLWQFAFPWFLRGSRDSAKYELLMRQSILIQWGYYEANMKLLWGRNEVIMRANLLSLLITILSFSFLQVSGSRNSTRIHRTPQKHPATHSSVFCERDRGEILFMAHAVVLAKVRNVTEHLWHIYII